MRYVDSSRVAAEWVCPKSRYWGYEYAEKGLTPVESNPDLSFGLAIAEQVQRLRTNQPLVNPPGTQEGVLEMGLLLAYAARIWPTWLAEFDVVATELEGQYALSSDVRYMARPDAVLRRKHDHTIWVLSDKTTSLDSQRFTQLWDKHAQNHAECVCVEEQLGVEVAGFYTQGWQKGYKKAGTIYSPLAYAWHSQVAKEGYTEGSRKSDWRSTYMYGWTRRLVKDYPGGIAAWVAQLPLATVLDQFPVAGPIPLRRDLVDTYFEQILAREMAVAAAHWHHHGQPMFDTTHLYPQHFANCDEYGKYRRPCEFKSCCWAPTVGRDPVGSGLYQMRVPHHAVESEAFRGKVSV